MAQQEQTYANHRSVDRGLYVLALCILLAALLGVAGVFMLDTPVGSVLISVAFLLQAIAMLGFILKLRRYAVILQDRIIRAEMRARLERVLPKDLNERAKTLTVSQLVGLRYAADRELPELVEKVLTDKIMTADAIKRLVKHWQPDHLRV